METEDKQRQLLVELANSKMPYGKYKGYYLIDLPEHYLVWYRNKGFPAGKFGEKLHLVYEIQLNGLEDMVRKLKV
ncbi:DUF3820 family protein [Lutibacter sp.]|uniref:DUF3820 family protein n=1 Tax=Lutibacter sp. TaxID=1925666 RepID=UPI0027376075|nr:DUF3820 family protein [Lutibacter sp.]MDP3311813.1 DUF3820 family protein [Lutibacter sp.]